MGRNLRTYLEGKDGLFVNGRINIFKLKSSYCVLLHQIMGFLNGPLLILAFSYILLITLISELLKSIMKVSFDVATSHILSWVFFPPRSGLASK